MKVDPAGLVSAVQRVSAALAQLPSGDTVHPPLAADPVAQGAAARLTTAGATLAALIGEQMAGLAATAAVLEGIATGFSSIDDANTQNLRDLSGAASSAPVSGFAPPAIHGPDVRPPLPPPVAVLGEPISRAVHAGDPAAGEQFISGWTRVADAVDDAADVVAQVADTLPETWDSTVATPVVRAHLTGYRTALSGSGRRARGLGAQARQHSTDVVAARHDIPTPQQWDELNEQWRQTWQANLATGGKFAPALAALNERKVALNGQAVQGYGDFYLSTDATTAPQPLGDTGSPGNLPGPGAGADSPAAAGNQPGDPADSPLANPERASQLAGMIPSLIPTVLGAAGGAVGGVMSAVMKAPEALAQAATEAAGAAMQGMQGLSGGPPSGAGDDRGGNPADAGDPGSSVADPGLGGGGAGETTPAGGGPSEPTPPVLPSTGAVPTPAGVPAGALPDPVAATPGGAGGMMPMGMPMGGMTPPGGGPGGAQRKLTRTKDVVVAPTPHTEAVTGKLGQDRLAMSSTAPSAASSDPPDDSPPDAASTGSAPIVRRITMAHNRDDPP